MACRGRLLMAFHVFERVGVRAFITRLMWLHWRYGPRVALSTLHPCRYLHERKTRFPVGWLGPCRGGNDTRWKRWAWPGAPKHFDISSLSAYCGRNRILLKRAPMASWQERPGRKP